MVPENDGHEIVPVTTQIDQLIHKIIESDDIKHTQDLVEEFRIMSLKKELLRLVKLSQFSDLADTEIGRRLEKYPERLKSSELLEFSRLIQESITRINTQMVMFQDTAGMFAAGTAPQTVNIVNNTINLESVKEREKVRIAASSILDILKGSISEDDLNSLTPAAEEVDVKATYSTSVHKDLIEQSIELYSSEGEE